MPVQRILFFFTLCVIIVTDCYCFEPISTTTGLGFGLVVSVGYAGYQYIKCGHMECCDDTWIRPNVDGLKHDLTTRLHGQHLVNLMVTRAIQGHIRNKNPKKALVMAFHGWTGSGKNHASKIIVENLFKNGVKSSFSHLYISTHHFPHVREIDLYKDKLQREIREHTKLCGRSVFVFDEIDKMPPGLIDALKPYIDYHEEVDGIDYRRNIFIFLSNTGGTEISKVAYNFWLKGHEREAISMKDIEPLVNKGAFNEKGGLQYSEIIEKNLIDMYIPFLPLEKEHVRLCVKDELRSRGKTAAAQDSRLINRIADQLQYWPPDFDIYSKSGCKKISHKVDLYGDDSV